MHSLLEEIGLTRGEVKVYLTLLEVGSATSGPIILKSKVSRSKVYEILERLKEKGLVSEVIKDQVRYYQALSPKKILEYLKGKEQALSKQKMEFEKILPSLLNRQNLIQNKQYVKTYVGVESIKTFYYEMVEHLGSEEYLGTNFSEKARKNATLLLMFHKFHKERERKGSKSKILCTKDSSIVNKMKKSGVYEFRGTNLSLPADISIFKDTVATFSWTDIPVVFAITCKENAEKYRTFFYDVWKSAKKF